MTANSNQKPWPTAHPRMNKFQVGVWKECHPKKGFEWVVKKEWLKRLTPWFWGNPKKVGNNPNNWPGKNKMV